MLTLHKQRSDSKSTPHLCSREADSHQAGARGESRNYSTLRLALLLCAHFFDHDICFIHGLRCQDKLRACHTSANSPHSHLGCISSFLCVPLDISVNFRSPSCGVQPSICPCSGIGPKLLAYTFDCTYLHRR